MQQQTIERPRFDVLLSSLIASVTSTILTNPIQVFKLKLQYAPISCSQYPHKTYRELFKCDCITFSLKDSFKGLSILIPQVVFSNIVFMQLYEEQRKYYIQYMDPTKSTVISSVISRLVASTIMNPVEAFRVRTINSTINSKILTNQWALKITLIRDLTFSALYWSLVETVRNQFSGKQYRGSNQQGNFNVNAVAGIIAGGFVAGITTPLDTIKTRMQSGIKLEGSVINQIRLIYLKEGLHGLFAGVYPRAMKSGFHSSLYLILYEHILKMVKKSNYSSAQNY